MSKIAVLAPDSQAPAPDSPPDGFDPAAMPILAAHWFRVKPGAAVAADTVADVRFRRHVERLHTKGPRVVAEFLAELGTERLMTTVIEAKLDRFLTVPDEALDATGGRQFPAAPLHRVRE